GPAARAPSRPRDGSAILLHLRGCSTSLPALLPGHAAMIVHASLAALLVAASLSAQSAPPAVVFERNTLVPMRDGVKLAFDIWRPAAGRVPAILQRTPYGTDREGMEHANDAMVQMGYAMVTVDCRGKFASEGEWYPLRHEALDGYDCIEWIASQ